MSSELIELISSDSEDESTNVSTNPPSSSRVNHHLSPSPKGKLKSNHDTSSDDSPKKEVDLFTEDAPTLPPSDFEFTENNKKEDDDGMTQAYRLPKDGKKDKKEKNDSFSEDAPTLAPSEFEYTEEDMEDDSKSIQHSTSFSEDAPTLPPSDFEFDEEEDDGMTQAYRLPKDKKKKSDSFSEDAPTLAPSEFDEEEEEDTKDEEMESNECAETQGYSLFKDINESDEEENEKEEQEEEEKQKSESDEESEEFSFKKPENPSSEKISDEPSSPEIGRNPAPSNDSSDSVSASLSFTDMADQWSKRKQKITETKGLGITLFVHFNILSL